MEREPATTADHALVAAAVRAVQALVSQPLAAPAPPLVGAAVRLSDGSIETAVNLIADVGGLSICAEPIAIAQAARRPDLTIEAIVAVHHAPGHAPRVVSPCGRCREAITDYAPHSYVILRAPTSQELFRVSASDLLPYKYAVYWNGENPL